MPMPANEQLKLVTEAPFRVQALITRATARAAAAMWDAERLAGRIENEGARNAWLRTTADRLRVDQHETLAVLAAHLVATGHDDPARVLYEALIKPTGHQPNQSRPGAGWCHCIDKHQLADGELCPTHPLNLDVNNPPPSARTTAET